jgi:polysaccharide biosynthesis protein PelE
MKRHLQRAAAADAGARTAFGESSLDLSRLAGSHQRADGTPASRPAAWRRDRAVALAIGGVELALGVALLAPGVVPAEAAPWGLALALGVHAGLMALWCAYLGMTRAWPQHPVQLLYLLTTLVLGPLGVLGSALTFLLWWTGPAQTLSLEARYAALLPDVSEPASTVLVRRILRGERDAGTPGTLEPFADLMAHGSVEQKQAAIALIMSEFKPALAPALHRALNDADASVRVQAATAMARIESRFLDLALDLEARVASEPDNLQDAFALARHYDDYAITGLLDANRTLTARERALALFQTCAGDARLSLEAEHAIVRLRVRMGELDAAVSAAEPLIAAGRATPALQAWYLECLFKQGQFDALREACRGLLAAEPGGAKAPAQAASPGLGLRHAMAFWVEQGRDGRATPKEHREMQYAR